MRRTWLSALLVLLSGAGALVCQMAWTRELRLLLGASTAASSAVLAVFMGGLGVGGLVLGKRADREARPLAFYGKLEIGVAGSAAITPFLLAAARYAYAASGGTLSMGTTAATIVRVLLTALVLGAPTFLMGGTLPAIARHAEVDADEGRRSVGWLYAANSLGAVLGCLLATFVLLEKLGTHRTLWLACGMDAVAGAAALLVARRTTEREASESDAIADATPAPGENEGAERTIVLATTALVGFAFFTMEMVWSRMLVPLLGGTIFTFGLVLALALLGIAIGGAMYGARAEQRAPTLSGLAWISTLEALALAIPYALGDRLAILALLLRPLGHAGFVGHVTAWTLVASIVVLPASIAAGVQFPLLIGLLGHARRRVARDVGLAYAFNTAGAIGGALAGGFGLLPLMSATGCWRLLAGVLASCGVGTSIYCYRADRKLARLVGVVATMLMVLSLLRARGPSPAWRDSGIGAGRLDPSAASSPNRIAALVRDARREVAWESDGVESHLAIVDGDGYAFVVNGKNDGNARDDAATQVMAGLLGALLHPAPKDSLVIGLGTGSTAGWLAKVPTMESVDVVELEPAVVEMARRSSKVNEDVLDNPRVHLHFGDGREALTSTTRTYDVVFSEPSNPYRAGVASLYTHDFYREVSARLRPHGVLVQWVQTYDVDASSMASIYATMTSVFPHVQSWQALSQDLMLVASNDEVVLDGPTLAARVREEPYARAMRSAWRGEGLEGLFAHYVGRETFARAIAATPSATVATDDRNVLEFGFATSLGRATDLNMDTLVALARSRGEDLPDVPGFDADDAALARFVLPALDRSGAMGALPKLGPEHAARAHAWREWVRGNPAGALVAWKSGDATPRDPHGPLEEEMLAECASQSGDAEYAKERIAALRAWNPTYADGLTGILAARSGDVDGALDAFESAFQRYRKDPWPRPTGMARVLSALVATAGDSPERIARATHMLAEPFVLHALEGERTMARLALARRLPLVRSCVDALRPFEPSTPWDGDFLAYRRDCYELADSPLAGVAREELAAFTREEPGHLEVGGR